MSTTLVEPKVQLELQHLLSGLCDGELSDTDHDRLEHLLSSNSECRKIFLRYIDLHGALLLAGREHILTPRLLRDDFPCANDSDTTTVAQGSRPSESAGPAGPSLSRGSIAYRYLVVALFAILTTTMVHIVVSRFNESTRPTGSSRMANTPANSIVNGNDKYVATLRDAVDCVWEKPQVLAVGSRLAPGDFQMPKGVAYVQFDSGPEIVVEGPAKLRLDSSTAATILSGKVVLRADEAAAPFDLHTPNATFAEAGTEFAVAVNSDAEEIHVFAGEVQRTPRSDHGSKTEHLRAGEARRYFHATALGKPTTCDPKKFIRHLASNHHGHELLPGLLAYEGFEYRMPNALISGKANGGKGWFGPWKSGFTSPPDMDSPRFTLNPRENLTRPESATSSVGGSFDYSGFATAFRRLARPIRMDSSINYYLSFLVCRHGAQSDPFNSAGIMFWTNDDVMQQKFENGRQRLFIGIKKQNQLMMRLQQMDAQASIPMADDAVQLVVAKIACSRTGSDQIFLRVYAPEDKVDSTEPTTSWSLTSSQLQSDLTFDWLQLHINSKTRQTLDEIRVGTTWSSVTAAHQNRPRT